VAVGAEKRIAIVQKRLALLGEIEAGMDVGPPVADHCQGLSPWRGFQFDRGPGLLRPQTPEIGDQTRRLSGRIDELEGAEILPHGDDEGAIGVGARCRVSGARSRGRQQERQQRQHQPQPATPGRPTASPASRCTRPQTAPAALFRYSGNRCLARGDRYRLLLNETIFRVAGEKSIVCCKQLSRQNLCSATSEARCGARPEIAVQWKRRTATATRALCCGRVTP